MDVKSAFLYGTIEEEVYVCQPPGFEDLEYPDKVYKVVKALYGLHQALRAWYETLATYLLENGFQRGTIDQTLFIKKQQKDILFVKQKKDGIFINQDKYVAKILRRFGLSEGKLASTLIDTEKLLLKDSDGEDVDVHTYSINETPAQKEAKRRKLHEQAKEDEDLKKQLEVVVDEDDDVFIEATPIGRKVPVVDYEIVMINNKPRYKIIRADDTHQLYISFITLLKNFDREDLEDLWRIVKDRFSTSKPTNFSDDYLLSTLKTMFEKTDGQDDIWRNQQSVYGQALVKSWKLLTSCGVHIISLTTTTFILLVEKRYLLSKFTLEQLVNVVRLKVEEESEMLLELLRFTRQQLQEYQQG
nr:hypothetical protein [Tanacetum cinerariifolium]